MRQMNGEQYEALRALLIQAKREAPEGAPHSQARHFRDGFNTGLDTALEILYQEMYG